ncbi:transglycosylase domain-containing protein [Alkalihalobacillus oceani]|uniref:transglycosylase domain-containing protein n=1 Tax=Halalkalibacter oceani TaxID=1653776 RepID=UPI0020405C65|nr:transglycosylase domain-containing protein [Halalkalibacter oceani]MCM3761382.1 transglycosylase domain-containing protein [Halalkalibacter oceani]
MRLQNRSAAGYAKKTGLFLILFAALAIVMNGSIIYGFNTVNEKDGDAVLYYSSSTIHKITEAQAGDNDDLSSISPVMADGTEQGIEAYLHAATEHMIHSQRNLMVEDYLYLYTESEASKRQLLDQYLKSIQSGSEVWCILTAAETYLGKEVRELTVEETAMLVGHILPDGEQTMSAVDNRYASESPDGDRMRSIQQMSSEVQGGDNWLPAPLTFPQPEALLPAERTSIDTL